MEEASPHRATNAFLFWTLTLMGMAAFAPSVLLPEWRDYESVFAEQRAREQGLALLEIAVADEQRKLEALQSDPATIARLAQRELSFRRAGEQVVLVGHGTDPRHLADSELGVAGAGGARPLRVESPPLPASIATWIARAPGLDYDALFCDHQTRSVLMTLSLSLIVLAFVLFGRRPDTADPEVSAE